MNKEIYHYDPHDLFYLGAQTIIDYREGRGQIPYAATDIPPPPRWHWPDNHVPIFSRDKKVWGFSEDQFWEIQVEEINFYTGRNSTGPTYLLAEPDKPTYQLELLKFSNLFIFPIPRFGSVPNSMHLCERIDFINLCISQLEMHWSQTQEGNHWPVTGVGANHYQSFAETLVAAIRRFLDDLTVVIFLRQFKKYEPWKRDLVIDGYSNLLGKNPRKKIMHFFSISEKGEEADKLCEKFLETVLGEGSVFLQIVQGLNNAYKHSAISNIARATYGRDAPTLQSYGTADMPPRSNLSNIVNHNHDLRQIVSGLNDYLEDVVGNLAIEEHPIAPRKCSTHDAVWSKSMVGGPYNPLP